MTTNQKTKKLRKTTTAYASTGDVTLADTIKLRAMGRDIAFDEYGHLVALPDQTDLKDEVKCLKAEGFSNKFVRLVKQACQEGARHLRLDCDEKPIGKLDPSWT